ncbi:cation:dicarboxylate symporter family transporter [Hespellia stercorisuis]|uniref:Na+/H+-dicarboxylate symporter n=1 Tax=Hespellia stercorisuis DSM 15480 TaxID=1121950 RepID=A0A1M6J1N2_9FIRM|nr:cation:dicarboxylase symporter family transporter [Hespellia stercorisuis]SHJ40644.1 Na+/H+-dicarboxylate symporter [Hespellia stercorisuis DSM 15480]
MKKLGLLPRLLLGIVVGIIVGSIGNIFGLTGVAAKIFGGFVSVVATFSSLFGTFLSFIIPLLIVSFVAVGLADLGKKANKLFGITLVLAYASTIIAGFAAFFLGKAALPSLISKISHKAIEGSTYNPLFEIAADPVFGVMTALILAFILGLGMANSKNNALRDCIRNLQEIITMVLQKVIIPLIPVYIACSFCKIAAVGELFPTIKMFAKLYIVILVFQWTYILIQFDISSIFCKENKYKKLRRILPAYFTALGTQSSAATIPINLESAKNNGVSNDIADFVIPLCATIHLAGDTICLVIGSMGIMIASGITPTLGTFAPFILMLGVTMVAAPGVPGGGVMAALGLIESMLGFTDGMQELIIALHFSQDSFGTATNITGDQAIAFMVDKIDERNAAKEGK